MYYIYIHIYIYTHHIYIYIICTNYVYMYMYIYSRKLKKISRSRLVQKRIIVHIVVFLALVYKIRLLISCIARCWKKKRNPFYFFFTAFIFTILFVAFPLVVTGFPFNDFICTLTSLFDIFFVLTLLTPILLSFVLTLVVGGMVTPGLAQDPVSLYQAVTFTFFFRFFFFLS